MAIYDPTTPAMFLTGEITQVIGLKEYEYVDNTQINFTGAFETYEITVTSISYQSIGTAETRSGVAKQYNGLDIKAGDWITNETGHIVLNIIRVIEKTTNSITFEARDVDMIVYKTYANSILTIGNDIAFFQVSDNRVPMIVGHNIAQFFTAPLALDKIQGRFAAEEETERYRFEFTTPNTFIDKGDIVTVDKSNGQTVKYGSANASEIPIGVVIEKIMNNTVIYVKPFNTIVDNHTSPELLTGSAGDIYYAHPSNPGAMATTKYPGAMPLFLQIKDAEPTTVIASESDYLPTASDSLIINNITAFDGSVHLVPNTVGDFVSLINQTTSSHKVAASYIAEFASASSVGTDSAVNVSAILVSDDGGSTYNGLTTTFSDGTNSVTVTLDENTGATLVPYPPAPSYLTYSASIIAPILNTAFTNAGVNLEASSSLPGNGLESDTYGILTITATDPGASINITGSDLDKFGNTFVTAMGIPASTPASSSYLLKLTRADGGDILITGQGTYINRNGIASSSSGTAPILLMLEGADKEQETGVSTNADKDQSIIATTTHDHFVTGIDMDYTPFADSSVIVKVNGVEVNIGDGDNTEDCYFTDPTDAAFNTIGDAMIARSIADITAGDVLIWNPSAAGYQLDVTDDIDVIYDASSYDL
mgnify:CR=1 FL=1